MFFNNNPHYPIGLDISDLSIKAVQLNRVRNKIKIQAISKVNLNKGVIENGELLKPSEVIKAIKKLFSDVLYGKFSSDEVVASLPESKTFLKLIEIPKSPNPVADLIGHEIEKHIPLTLNEIYYDWQAIENTDENNMILIGAAPQNIVNKYSDLLDQAKLFTVALEVEPISICRSLLKEETPEAVKHHRQLLSKKNSACDPQMKNYAIIDIGACHTSMIFYSKNTILFTISIPISGQQITDTIAANLELTPEQAEKAKIICGLADSKAEGIIKKILEGNLEKLIEKIKQSVEFYNSYYKYRCRLNEIQLCGGGANIGNLANLISGKMNIEVKLADPLINLSEAKDKFLNILSESHQLKINRTNKNIKINKNNNISISQDTSLTYATAIGLALRNIFLDE